MTVFNIFCPSNFDDLRVQISWLKFLFIYFAPKEVKIVQNFWYLTKTKNKLQEKNV